MTLNQFNKAVKAFHCKNLFVNNGVRVVGYFFDPKTKENSDKQSAVAIRIFVKGNGVIVIWDCWGNEYYPKDQEPNTLQKLIDNAEPSY